MGKRTGSIAVAIVIVLICCNQMTTIPVEKRVQCLEEPVLSGYIVHDIVVIMSNEDFETQSWPGNGTANNPYVIAGLNITSDERCIYVYNTSVYFRIENCLLSSFGTRSVPGIHLLKAPFGSVKNCIIDTHEEGIHVQNSNHCNVTDNICYNNLWSGVYFQGSDYGIAENNTCYDNGGGVTFAFSDHSTLSSNNATSNNNGITVSQSLYVQVTENIAVNNGARGFDIDFSDFCTITFNNVSGSGDDGFYIEASEWCNFTNNRAIGNGDEGFDLEGSYDCYLDSNFVASNSGNGIALQNSHDNLIVRCNISLSTYSGFNAFEGSSGNEFYFNRLDSNILINARDYGISNQWDDGIEYGNYWSDYDGDGSYILGGTSGAVDNYPFSCGNVPFLSHPRDMTLELGSMGYSLTWEANDINQSSYELYLNEALETLSDWNESTINVSLDNLGIASYNFTIVVSDILDNSAIDTVFVNIVDTTAPSINHPADIEYEEETPNQSITWTPYDLDPDSYYLYRNEILLIDNHDWNGSQVIINVTGLSEGLYNYTIVLFDGTSNSVVDTVMVNVTASIPTSTTTTTTTSTTSSTTTESTTSETSTTPTSTTSTNSGPGLLNDNSVLFIGLGIGGALLVLVVLFLFKKRT